MPSQNNGILAYMGIYTSRSSHSIHITNIFYSAGNLSLEKTINLNEKENTPGGYVDGNRTLVILRTPTGLPWYFRSQITT
jgi:hypothetical protein